MALQTTDIPGLSYSELAEHIRLAKVNPGHYVDLHESLAVEMHRRSPTVGYRCMKCSHEEYELSEIRTERSFLSSLFNVQSAKYSAVVCSRCSFTEFYRGRVSATEQAVDFILGS